MEDMQPRSLEAAKKQKRTSPSRPFYAEYAWAFDLIVDRPVRKECAVIASWLTDRGFLPGATLLDAGCGTGRYSIELARRGYLVHGIDLSPELIDIASRSLNEARGSVSFAVGDILDQPAGPYDAILCRGVLNDFVGDDERAAVFTTFARILQPPGALILDVREWTTSAARKAHEPLFRKSVDTDRGRLTFTSTTEVDRDTHRLLLSERHTLITEGQERTTDYQFEMRCLTHAELQSSLEHAGFEHITYFGAYDTAVDSGATDRLVAVAQLSREARST
jgi:SAM-dependent methyltransferase